MLRPVLAIMVSMIFADAAILSKVSEQLGLTLPPVIQNQDGVSAIEAAAVLDFQSLSINEVEPGVVTAATGAASYRYVDAAINCALGGSIDAIVTGPINKEAWRAAGVRSKGYRKAVQRLP